MKNLRVYKSKYSYINNFFWNNNLFLMMADTNKKNTVTLYDLNYNNQKYLCAIMNNKLNGNKKFEVLKKLTFNVINDNIPDYLYVNKRYNVNSEIYLSKKMSIKIKRIDDRVKNAFIIYNYFKIKDLIKNQGYNTFLNHYKLSGGNEYLSNIYDKINKKLIKCSIDDYFYIGSIKNIIHIYCNEVDNRIDYKNPLFKNKLLFKYLDNYFSKYLIIDYDRVLVKEWISKYYITENQSDDKVYSFIQKFLSFYKIISNMRFQYKNNYDLNFKHFSLFNHKKIEKIKYKNFYKYFDNILEDKDNYYNFMFLIEILELNEKNSDKKNIVNYVSALELLLVKGDKKISNQFQRKIIKLLNNAYLENELRLIYDYRSKIVHGDYKGSIEKLQELSLIKKYEITKEDLDINEYSNFVQLLEEKIRIQLFKILTLVLKIFVFHNEQLTKIKNIK